MIYGSCWGEVLDACAVSSEMPPRGSTLGGGAGGTSGVVYGVANLEGGVEALLYGFNVCIFGVSCVGVVILKLS